MNISERIRKKNYSSYEKIIAIKKIIKIKNGIKNRKT